MTGAGAKTTGRVTLEFSGDGKEGAECRIQDTVRSPGVGKEHHFYWTRDRPPL